MAGYKWKAFLCGVSLLMPCIILAQAANDYTIVMETVNVTRHSSRYLGEYKVDFWIDENGMTVLDIDLEIKEQVRKLSALLVLDIGSTEKSRVNLVRLNADVCKFLTGDYNFSVVKRIYLEMAKHGNIPRKCPIYPNTYHLTNFTAYPSLFPPIVRKMAWSIELSFNVSSTPLVTLIYTGRVQKINP